MLTHNTNFFYKYITKSLIISKHTILNKQIISVPSKIYFKILINQESKFDFLIIFWFFTLILKKKPRISLFKSLKTGQTLNLIFNTSIKSYDPILNFIKLQKGSMSSTLDYCKKNQCFFLHIRKKEFFFKKLDYILTRLELKPITAAIKIYFVNSKYITEIKPMIY